MRIVKRLRILLTTTGSLGDLHPFIAIGLELQARGHAVTLATSDLYRPKVEQTGLTFAPMGPHLRPDPTGLARRLFDLRNGPEYLIRNILCPSVPAAYAEVMESLRNADLIVTHPIAYAAQIAAEKTGIPWVSTVMSPLSFLSRFDPSVLPAYPWMMHFRSLGPAFHGAVRRIGEVITRAWLAPLRTFRATLGLPPGRNPIFDGQHSPQRVLALFSRLMGEPQPDWPVETRITGFPLYDLAEHGQGIDVHLERFLDAGPPPVVFTLGSSAVYAGESFFDESLAAIRRLGCRAVMLAGECSIPKSLPSGTAVFPYAPFSRIFPRAAAVVHQGGIGTSAQALAAGRPMLVVPFGFDQPDNAVRLQRLGVARVISRTQYNARRVSSALEQLLANSAYAQSASSAAREIAGENGAAAASSEIERQGGAR